MSLYKGEVSDTTNMTNMVINRCYEKEDINIKLKEVFNANNFVYKKNAVITLNNGTNLNVSIVGRSGNYLITLDHGNILISDIKNISI
ncbi:MAG: hypothetical protein J5892_04830 [Bacilli bacterium]|nr:hypothetical protein [Bacilli bacterium]